MSLETWAKNGWLRPYRTTPAQIRLGHSAIVLPFAALGFAVDRDLDLGFLILDDLGKLHLGLIQVCLGFLRILCANCAARKFGFGRIFRKCFCKMVGAVRFELTTSCTRNKRASRATLRPDYLG
jgi:hypothetical protein